MVLSRINPKNIKWQRKGILYRGNTQWKFEHTVLRSMISGVKPVYKGCEDSEGIKTFCSNLLTEAIIFTRDRTREHSTYARRLESPFTIYPLIMEINVVNYTDKIYQTNEGEGLIITGSISLDDINIIFSSKKDLIPNLPVKKSLQELCRQADFKEEDLVERFEKNREEISLELYSKVFGPKISTQYDYQKEIKFISEFIEVLRTKFR